MRGELTADPGERARQRPLVYPDPKGSRHEWPIELGLDVLHRGEDSITAEEYRRRRAVA